MKKEPLDIKFIVGTVILVAVLVLMGSFFWRTVAKQAAIVKEEEAKEEAAARHAIYMYYGNRFKKGIFVDMDTEELFLCSVPKNGIYNKNGTLIAGDVLEEGDKVRIYGDNVLTDSVPPEYKGVTKMQRTGRATLEEAEVYRKIVENVSAGWEDAK
ncbi:MAG: hypothetical protein J6D53_04960 [Blautia sp.]|nr:hypothetical protein [Blautia sp.]